MAAPAENGPVQALGRPSLLLAEGDARTLTLLELGLRKAGYSVRTARDGEQALEALRAAAPDLLVCDLTLPGKDGFAIAAAVREDDKLATLPMLVLCPDDSPALKARVMEAGADDLLARPILVQELAHRVALLLERRRRSQPPGPAPLLGKISDLGLLDLFSSLEAGRKSAVVKCEAPGQLARVWVRDGQVIDAELGMLGGDEAFWRLMTWGSGAYRVDFGEVDRERRIAGGTQGALSEALRRVDELVRAAESLPMGSHLRVDLDALARELRELPDEVNGVLRCFDGKRTLREAMDLSPLDDLSTLAIVRRLLDAGILRGDENEAQKPTLQQWLSDPPSIRAAHAEDRAAELVAADAETVDEIHAQDIAPTAQPPDGDSSPPSGPPGLIHFPPLRGARRERLRREAEDARARIDAGHPVRLTHVVELPAFEPHKADATGASRQLSEAVGEAAKRFAPDLPLARILRQSVGGEARDPATPPGVGPVAPSPPPKQRPLPRQTWMVAAASAALAVALIIGVRARKRPPIPPAAARPAVPPQLSAERPDTTPQPPAAPAPGKSDPAAYAKAMEQGEALLSKGKYKAAVEEFKRAVELRPTSQPALLALGDACLEADMPKNAVEPLEAAALLDPRSSRAQLLLGTAYQSLGRNADAIAAYQRYLTLEPQGRFSRDVQLILANLQKRR